MDLPWWFGVSLLKDKWQDKAWIGYHPIDLKRTIQQYPLTQDIVLTFLHNHVTEIYERFFTGIIVEKTPYKFKIIMNKEYSEEESCDGLIHEVVHGVYRVSANKGWSRTYERTLEELISKEAGRFYQENRSFVKELLKKYVPFNFSQEDSSMH